MKNALFSLIFILILISFTASQSYAKLDVLREVDNLVEAGRPNVLIIVDHTAAMNGSYTETAGAPGFPTHNDGDTTSRFFHLKDVMKGLAGVDGGTIFPEDSVLEITKGMVNYGLMTFQQFNYWPYFTQNCQLDPDSCSIDVADENKPAMIMEPANNPDFDPYTVLNPGFFDYVVGTHNGTDFDDPDGTDPADEEHPIDGATYYLFNYGDDVHTNKDPIAFYKATLGSNEGAFLGGMIRSHLNPDEDPLNNIADIQTAFRLQNKGGLVVSGNSAGIQRMFKDSLLTAEDAWNYFLTHVLPADTDNPAACFTKNYIIFLSSGINGSGNWNTVRNNTKLLKDGILWGGDTYPVKTFVIGLLDTSAVAGGLRSNLNDVARYGGTDANGTDGVFGLDPAANDNFGASFTLTTDDATSCSGMEALGNGGCNDYAFFVKSAEELKVVFETIIKTISGGDFVTGSPSATSSGGSFVLNDVGMLASAEYPGWRGHFRAVDLANDYFWWDAGATLFIDSCTGAEGDECTTVLPKARAHPFIGDTTDSVNWRDTNGDGTIDQPPLALIENGDIYFYADKVLYCKTNTTCKSSELASHEYAGKDVNFTINGTVTPFTYKGAFYLPPWDKRKVYTSLLDGTVKDLSSINDVPSGLSDLELLEIGDSNHGNWFGSLIDTSDANKVDYAEKIIYFALGAIKGFDLDGNGFIGDVDDSLDGVSEAAIGEDKDGDGILGTVDGIVEADVKIPREWTLGDITNVVAVGVGKPIDPNDGLTPRGILETTSIVERETIVYTGSNDQMLHAYDFKTGTEKFAYIPPDLLPNLKKLYDIADASSDPDKSMGQPLNPIDHIYGIASSPKANDVQFHSDDTWHTVLIGGTGPKGADSNYVQGDNHYFALDITDPTQTFGTSLYTVLWHTKETSLSSSYGNLGETWSVPAYGRLNDGTDDKFVVFAGSGYDDTTYGTEVGRTYNVIDVETGSLIKEIDTGDLAVAGFDPPAVRFGLLPDSVSIIKKSGSKVNTSYQVDLVGRLWTFDTGSDDTGNWESSMTSLEKTSGDSDRQFTPNIAKPFYYSPAIWDFDKNVDYAPNLMILGSGAYDDVDADSLDATLYFMITKPAPHTGTPLLSDVISVDVNNLDLSEADTVNTDGASITISAVDDLRGSKMLASPVLFNNATTGNLEALFLVFSPPTADELGCSFGESFLVIFGLGTPETFSGSSADTTFDTDSGAAMHKVLNSKPSVVVSVGIGKVSGIGIAGGGSHVVVGQSGYGAGDTSGFSIAGGQNWNPLGTVTKQFWKEVTY